MTLKPFQPKKALTRSVATPSQKAQSIMTGLFYLASIFLVPVVLLPVMGGVEWVVAWLNPEWNTSSNETALLIGLSLWSSLTLSAWVWADYRAWRNSSSKLGRQWVIAS